MRSLLTRRVVEVGAEERLADVSRLIAENKASHCVVVERPGGGFVGVVRIRDAVTKPADRIFADLISELPAYRVNRTAPRAQVFERIEKENVEDAVVLSDGGKFVGVVTRESVLQWKRDELDRLKDARGKESQVQAKLLQRLREKARKQSRELARAISQLEELSYAVSHEVRTPLRAMRGYAQALQEEYGAQLDDSANDYLRRIIRANQHLDRLTTGVVGYSQIARAKLSLQKVDLSEIVAEALEASKLMELGAVVSVGTLLPVRADRALLARCVEEFISNALKFCPKDRKPSLHIWMERSGATVYLKIKDNGIGVRPEHRARIFQLFEQVHGAELFSGMGIGLALVRAAAERLGGSVGVDAPEKGEGSCFWLRLPA